MLPLTNVKLVDSFFKKISFNYNWLSWRRLGNGIALSSGKDLADQAEEYFPVENPVDVVEPLMILALSEIEDQFLSSSPCGNLPPTWQVIYQEAIRGNHILFSKGDLAAFNENSDLTNLERDLDVASQVSELAYQVLTAPSFPAMTEIIDRGSFEIRHGLFKLYQRYIALWTSHLKISLH